MSGESFYSNREIYEMLCQETDERKELSKELQRTLHYMQKYNGLNEKIDACGLRLETLENERTVKTSRVVGQVALLEGVKKWSVYIIGLITFGYWLSQILGGGM